MRNELPWKALKAYADKFGINYYVTDYLNYEFIPIFKREKYVWVHSASIVRYMHLTNPKEFTELNRYNFVQLSETHAILGSTKSSRSFRLIRRTEFERVTGIKV